MGAFGALDPSSNLGRAIIINKQSDRTRSYISCACGKDIPICYFLRNSSKNWGNTKDRMQAGTKKSFQEMRISCNNIIHTPGRRGMGQTLSIFIAFYHLVIVAVVIVVRFWSSGLFSGSQP
jgi:hypothetical protein